MPNKLAAGKRRQSLAEHEVVLAALADIARHENTTSMALLRQALRNLIKTKVRDPVVSMRLRRIVGQFSPRPPASFSSPAQLSRFKRAQREFDQVLTCLDLFSRAELQERNSAVSAVCPLQIREFNHE